MIRLLLPYNKTILKNNLILSVFLSILSILRFLALPTRHSIAYIIIFIYTAWILTGGFLLSASYFEMTRKNEYYFYYNLGISKIKLILTAYLLNFIFVVPLLIALYYVWPSWSRQHPKRIRKETGIDWYLSQMSTRRYYRAAWPEWLGKINFTENPFRNSLHRL